MPKKYLRCTDRCRMCNKLLNCNNQVGVCRGRRCRVQLYKEDKEFRKRVLKNNRNWQTRKRERDPEWYERLKVKNKLRARRQK